MLIKGDRVIFPSFNIVYSPEYLGRVRGREGEREGGREGGEEGARAYISRCG